MIVSKKSLFSLGFVILAFGLAAALYGRLPDPVPTHWTLAGQANGFTSKPWGPFVLPLVMVAVWLLFALIPSISPRGYRIENFRRVFEVLQVTIIAFLFICTVVALLAGAGTPVPIHRLIQAAIGLLLVVVGNFMGKLTKNFFLGIRTPWTLASDEVWLRTHRLAGRLLVLAGAFVFVSGLLGGGFVFLLLALAIACGIPAVCSYFIYRRIEGFQDPPCAGDSTRQST